MTHECVTTLPHGYRSWTCRRCGAVWQLVPEFDSLFGHTDVWFKVTASGPIKRFPWAWLFMIAAAIVAVIWVLFTAVEWDAYALTISMLLGGSGVSWLLQGGMS